MKELASSRTGIIFFLAFIVLWVTSLFVTQIYIETATDRKVESRVKKEFEELSEDRGQFILQKGPQRLNRIEKQLELPPYEQE